jgi:hypothetical protein
MPKYNKELYDLRAKVVRLKQRIEDLETLLEIGKEKLPVILGPDARSRSRSSLIAELLLTRKFVSKDAVMLVLGAGDRDDNLSAVYICRLRSYLSQYDIKIQTVWNKGWFMKSEDKAKLRAIMVKAA